MSVKHRIVRVMGLLAMFAMAISAGGAGYPTAVRAADQTLVEAKAEKVGIVLGEAKGETTADVYIVRLEGEPLAAYTGGVSTLKATSPLVTGERKLNVNNPNARAYRSYLATKRAEALSKVSGITGTSATPMYVYDVVYNGFALELTPAQAQEVAKLDGVASLERRQWSQPTTDAGPLWIHADEIWDGNTGNTAAGEIFAATLTGANEVPPVASQATGTATAWFDPTSSMLSVRVSTTGITGTIAHVHIGAAGTAGGVVFPLTAMGSMWMGSGTLDAAQTTALHNGGLYVNIHSDAHPGGEIRGQLLLGGEGEGMLVGIIDTGINFDHPSFAATGGDGYTHVNPFGAGNYRGVCDPASPQFDAAITCNSKLVGAYTWPDTDFGASPEDDEGHGSHTASTTAGNVISGTVIINGVNFGRISGVAPHANIIAYDGCRAAANGGGCPNTATIASMEQAVTDGVDVINYSIGGGSNDPWSNGGALAFLNARIAGVMVSASAGNSGPGDATIGSPSDAPWIMSVGNLTHNRLLRNALIDMSGGDTPAPADMQGKSLTTGYGPAEIVYAGDYPNPNDPATDKGLCQAPFPAGTFSGEIVVCDRGINPRVAKAENVAAGGAGGFVLANDAASGNSLVADAYIIPGVHITFADGVVLKQWLATGDNHMGTIQGTEFDLSPSNGDIMSSSSSRGENPSVPGVIKPDVAAPGTDIIAAWFTDPAHSGTDPEFAVISGTSMAAPHAAGASALLRMLYPDWTPSQVQSALMLTGIHAVRKEDGTTQGDPFDFGGGRIDVARAAMTPFVLNVPNAAYDAANPANNGNPSTLNIPSLSNEGCLDVCTWTRTISSTMDTSTSWNVTTEFTGTGSLTVSPSSFTLAPYDTQTLVITATTGNLAVDEWSFGYVNFSNASPKLAGALPPASMPVAIKPVGAVLPTGVTIEARRDAGSYLLRDVVTGDIPALQLTSYGFEHGTQQALSLLTDTSNGSPYDDLTDGIYTTTVAVAAGDLRLVVETYESTAADVDLYVHYDQNGDGIPTVAEQVCTSTTASADEYCDLENPQPGNYIILVQNWDGSADPNNPDTIQLSYAAVPKANQGNMNVTGPGAVVSLEPFNIRIFWDDASLEPGDRMYGVIGLGDTDPDDQGMFPVDLHRIDDDVSKVVSSPVIEPTTGQVTLTYTITVQPNTLPEDITYMISDTIPASMTLVPGSVTGGATVSGNTINWSGLMSAPGGAATYVQTTSNNDASCEQPLANSGKVLDLALIPGIPISTITGDDATFTAFASGTPTPAPVMFYDQSSQGLQVNTNGFLRTATPFFSQGATNTPMGVAAEPNNIMAAFWDDLIVTQTATSGVRLASTGPSANNIIAVQYDDIPTKADPNAKVNFTVTVLRSPSDTAGDYEITYGYLDLMGTGIGDSATVGVENEDATNFTQYHYNTTGGALSNGMVVCYDYQEATTEPHVITYQVTVNNPMAGMVYTNTVDSTTTNPGSELESTSATVEVMNDEYVLFMPIVRK